jgi:1-acyl-sn-glycerol-3-phosphate acyltransferase
MAGSHVRRRADRLHFPDAGHGYDPFGMHPDFVALGDAIGSFPYERWFRVRSRGHEHIPTRGPAIIAGNHSGVLPYDAMMLWVDVYRNTEPPRVARVVADYFVPTLPVISTLFARCGVVGGSRGNARALLDAGEMLMIFPEGTTGIAKPFSERYRLQRFSRGHAELAIRHRAPVVPVGLVGPEEQMPQLAKIPIKVGAIPFLPVPATLVPMPVRYHVRYGAPLPFDVDYRPAQADDPAVVEEAADRVKAAVADLVEAGLEARQGVFT